MLLLKDTIVWNLHHHHPCSYYTFPDLVWELKNQYVYPFNRLQYSYNTENSSLNIYSANDNTLLVILILYNLKN